MPKLGAPKKLRGYELLSTLTDLFRREGTAGSPVVFITQHGRYVPLTIRTFDRRGGVETQVLLIEEE